MFNSFLLCFMYFLFTALLTMRTMEPGSLRDHTYGDLRPLIRTDQ